MEHDISNSIVQYQNLLASGNIQLAYTTLIKYVAELKSKFPKQYATGNVSLGYLDYTYFPFSNDYLRSHKLRFGIVLNHGKMQFEMWLMGQNAMVQKKYWEILKKTDWNKHTDIMPRYSVLECCLEDNIDFHHKETMTNSILDQSVYLAGEIQDFLEHSMIT